MSADPLELRLLLQKYLYNSCTVDELEKFWRLMFELSGHEVVSEELKKLWNDNTFNEQPFADLPAWKKLSKKIQGETDKEIKSNRKKMIVIDMANEGSYQQAECYFFKQFMRWLFGKNYGAQKKLVNCL